MGYESEKQPKHPDLLDCPCVKEGCAWNGCFFENAIKRINPKKLGVERADQVESSLIEMAFDCKCKKANKLIQQRVKGK